MDFLVHRDFASQETSPPHRLIGDRRSSCTERASRSIVRRRRSLPFYLNSAFNDLATMSRDPHPRCVLTRFEFERPSVPGTNEATIGDPTLRKRCTSMRAGSIQDMHFASMRNNNEIPAVGRLCRDGLPVFQSARVANRIEIRHHPPFLVHAAL